MSLHSSFRRPRRAPMSEMNVVPYIDVMLVLLVIFMITAPLMTSALRLDLPKAESAQPSDAPQVIELAIDAQGQMFIGDVPADDAALSERIAEAARLNPATEVQLRADRSVPYGRVAELIGRVQKGGLSRIGFVAEPASR